MSDCYWVFIPDDPHYVPNEEMVKEIRALSFDTEEVTFEITDNVEFADCGGNLERISCPFCGKELDDWWGDAMDASYSVEKGFFKLDVVMPCCGKPSTLNKLDYYFLVGFCKASLKINRNFKTLSYEEDILEQLSKITGIPWLVIHRRI